MAAANRYLQETYRPGYNAEFAQPSRETGSAFVACRDRGILDDVLCEQFERTVREDLIGCRITSAAQPSAGLPAQSGSSNGTKSGQSICYQTGQVYLLLTRPGCSLSVRDMPFAFPVDVFTR